MDVTALGLGVDSDGLIKGTKALGDFAASSDKAGKSSDRFSETQSRSLQAIASMSRQLEKITALLSSIDKATAASAAGFAAQSNAMQQAATAAKAEAVALAQETAAATAATRATAELSTSTQRLTINFTQSAAAAGSMATATQAAATANQQQATSAVQAATATQQQAVAVQQLDAHVQAYKTNLLGMALATNGAFNQPQQFDAHVQAFKKLKPAVDDVGKSLKFTGMEGLNFSRQMADIGVTAAMGMNPLMIALQQGPQLFDILQTKAVATGATIGTVAKVAGAQIWTAVAPLLPIMAAIALAAGAIAAGFALGAREINKSTGDIAKSMDLTEKQMARLKKAGVETSVTMGDAFFAFFDVVGDRLQGAFDGPLKWLKTAWNDTLDFIVDYGNAAIKYVVGGFVGGVRGIAATWKLLPAAIGDAINSVANLVIDGIEFAIEKSLVGINWLIEQANTLLGTSISKFDENISLGRAKISGAGADFAATFSREFMAGIEDTGKALDQFAADWRKRAREIREKAIREAAGPGDAAKTGGGKTQGELFADLVGATSRDIAMIEAQTKALGMAEDAAMLLTNQQKLLNDAQAKGITLTDKQRGVLMGLAQNLTDARIALRKAENLKAVNEGFDDQIRALGQAAERIGVYGKALVELTTYQDALNKATRNGRDEIGPFQDAFLRGKAVMVAAGQAANDNAQFMEDLIQRTDEQARALRAEEGALGLTGAALHAYRFEQEALEEERRRHIDLTPAQLKAIHDTAQRFGALANNIQQAAENLSALNGGLGNIGGPLGQIMGALTSSNPTASLLGMGGVGTIAGLFTPGGRDAYKVQGQQIAASLKAIFPDLSDRFAGTLSNLFQGSAIGSTVAGVVGNGSQGSQIGGMAGGALGGAAFKEFASKGLQKALGAFGGPLASIAGAIAGSLLGGLFKKNATGSVILSGNQVTGTSGNGQRASQAGDLGSSVIQALDKISAILGVSANGNAAVSIGMRNDQFKVDPTGRGRTAESDVLTFSNAADAVKAALRIQIEKGVFEGLTEGVKKFLLNGDLETQLGKFANYKSALDEYAQVKDPKTFELAALADSLASLRATYTEIGAAAEDVAKIEELYAIKRNDVIEKYAAEAVQLEQDRQGLLIQIMELEGRSAEALAAARAMEKAQADASLGPLYDRIYALQDEASAAAEAAQKAEELAAKTRAVYEERRGLEERLLGLMGNTAELRRRELAALDPANRAILETIYHIEDLNTARAAEAAAAEELARKEQERVQNMAQYAQRFAGTYDNVVAAMQAANDNAAASTQRYVDSLTAQRSELQETIDRFTGFSDALRKFRDELFVKDIADPGNLAMSLARFQRTASSAAQGDAKALEGLPGAGRDYLDLARAQSSTLLEYQRQALMVASALDPAIGASDAVVDTAQRQVDYLASIEDQLKKTNERLDRVIAATQDADKNRQAEALPMVSGIRKLVNLTDDVTDGGTGMRNQAAA